MKFKKTLTVGQAIDLLLAGYMIQYKGWWDGKKRIFYIAEGAHRDYWKEYDFDTKEWKIIDNFGDLLFGMSHNPDLKVVKEIDKE